MYNLQKLTVEGDASSASYFFASACIGGGPIRVYGISEDSKQGDIKLLNVLKKIGATVRWGIHTLKFLVKEDCVALKLTVLKYQMPRWSFLHSRFL